MKASTHDRAIAALAACLLFASGACALVYEVAWARQLGVHLGRTAVAQATVVATFMAGLGLGYLLVARRADAVRRPLALYGVLELVIALWCAATPWLMPLLAGQGATTAIGRLLQAAAVMAVPTVCMGATLPILVAGLGRGADRGGRALAALYAANSAGAVAGALLAGYVLIEHLGLTNSIRLAALVNGGVALMALLLSRWRPADPSAPGGAALADELHGSGPASSSSTIHLPSLTRLLVIAAVVGAASMAVQAGWFRIFGVVLGSSTHSFALVVAAFVGGIALGSALLNRWLRIHQPSGQALAMCAAVGGGLIFAGLPAVPSLPWWLVQLRHWAANSGGGWADIELAKAALVVTLVALPAAFSGVILPLTGRLAMANGGASGSSTAFVFAASTVGSVLGAAFGGTWGVPTLGLAEVLRTGAALLVVAGLAALPWPMAGRSRQVASLSAAVLIVIAIVPLNWDPRLLTAGAFRGDLPDVADAEAWQQRWQRETVRLHRDGADATVTVLERNGRKVLKINGKPDASNRGDMLTQVASAHIPLLLHPHPERVLIIGLGSGVSVGSAALHGRHVDVLEISSAVVEASRHFDADSGAPLDRANVHLWRDDARSWLAGQQGPWQVIISEPSNPWMAGGGSLFTVEAFELVRSRLSPGGVLAQWFHCYEMDDELLGLVIRTLRSVFPHVAIWELYPDDLLLVASAQPLEVDLDSLAARALDPAIAADLARVDIHGPTTLLSLQAMSASHTAARLPAGPLHRDDLPILEHRATRTLQAGSRARLVRRHDARSWPLVGTGLLLEQWLSEHPISEPEAQALFRLHTRFPAAPTEFRMGLVPGLTTGDDVEFLIDLLFTLARDNHHDRAEPVALRLMQLASDKPRALLAIADLRLRQVKRSGETGLVADETARHLLHRCVALGDSKGRCKARLRQLAGVD